MAEGAETAGAACQFLLSLGTELCQGYLYSEPLTPDDFANSTCAAARSPWAEVDSLPARTRAAFPRIRQPHL